MKARAHATMQFGTPFKYLSNNLKLLIFPLDPEKQLLVLNMEHCRYFRGINN